MRTRSKQKRVFWGLASSTVFFFRFCSGWKIVSSPLDVVAAAVGAAADGAAADGAAAVADGAAAAVGVGVDVAVAVAFAVAAAVATAAVVVVAIAAVVVVAAVGVETAEVASWAATGRGGRRSWGCLGRRRRLDPKD